MRYNFSFLLAAYVVATLLFPVLINGKYYELHGQKKQAIALRLFWTKQNLQQYAWCMILLLAV